MAYMIVVWGGDLYGSGASLCGNYDATGYTFPSLDRAQETADRHASNFSSAGRCFYAVFSSGDRPRIGPDDFHFARLSAPVYVPPVCLEAARAQGWRLPGETLSDDALLAALSAPAPVSLYPINPALPLELEDGTPCELVEEISNELYLNVRVMSRPSGPMAGDSYPTTWNYHRETGVWVGSSEGDYLKLRNRVASPLIAAAAEAAKRPIPSPEAPQVRFEVRTGLNGTNRDDWSCVAQFDTGKEAADWQRDNGQQYRDAGKSIAIVRVELTSPGVDWRAREQARLDSGEYLPLPGRWFELISESYPDHFPHAASGDKRKVAFTETDASGERDRQKVLSAGEYVSRYFNDAARAFWYISTRQEFVADMLGSSVTVLMSPLGDADAIQSIYEECDTNGYDVGSCMSHSADDYSSHIHPVQIYALGGDLTVAFLRGYGDNTPEDSDEDGAAPERYDYDPSAAWDGDGPILARCLVWPEEKQFGRLYGNADKVRLLRTGLQAQGYSEGNLKGARLAKVTTSGTTSTCDCEECNPSRGTPGRVAYVMPYLDCGDGQFGPSEDGLSWVVGGPESGGSTGGFVLVSVPVECGHCGTTVRGRDTRSVTVGDGDTEMWCPSCFSDTRHCDHSSVYIPESEAVTIETDNRYRSSYVIASWSLEDFLEALDERPVLCTDGVYRIAAFQCRDCGESFATSDREVIERDHLCGSCADTRRASPELPLTIAA